MDGRVFMQIWGWGQDWQAGSFSFIVEHLSGSRPPVLIFLRPVLPSLPPPPEDCSPSCSPCAPDSEKSGYEQPASVQITFSVCTAQSGSTVSVRKREVCCIRCYFLFIAWWKEIWHRRWVKLYCIVTCVTRTCLLMRFGGTLSKPDIMPPSPAWNLLLWLHFNTSWIKPLQLIFGS